MIELQLNTVPMQWILFESIEWIFKHGLPFLGDPYEFVRKISTILLAL